MSDAFIDAELRDDPIERGDSFVDRATPSKPAPLLLQPEAQKAPDQLATPKKRNPRRLLLLLGVAAVLGAAGYF
ncbi:MAG TPA: hypothetical protein VG271_07240, partial [Beijerinckiaceae bacterium]|nr:hypothetical protein [Beijerinckiaceae bacterium]